ncbi:hypothetical protein BLOT_000962 [Blomia tropicalis]|nr:hypothetical protein BLOT_000962 [Blomia tropicalis]
MILNSKSLFLRKDIYFNRTDATMKEIKNHQKLSAYFHGEMNTIRVQNWEGSICGPENKSIQGFDSRVVICEQHGGLDLCVVFCLLAEAESH